MTAHREELVNPGKRLPDLCLPTLSGGAPLRLRSGREAVVLLLVHPAPCAACAGFVRTLEARADALEAWDGRVLVITPDATGEASGTEPAGRFPVLSDPEGQLAARLSLEHPATAIADQWGEIHVQEPAGEDHEFLSPDEMEEWLRFLATRCPECEGEAL